MTCLSRRYSYCAKTQHLLHLQSRLVQRGRTVSVMTKSWWKVFHSLLSDRNTKHHDRYSVHRDSEVFIGLLKPETEDNDQVRIKLFNQTDGSGTDANEGILAEDRTSDIAVYTQVGSSTGSASILNGVTCMLL